MISAKLIAILFCVAFIGCESSNPVELEKKEPPKFDCTGVWTDSTKTNNNLIWIFMLQDGNTVDGDIYFGPELNYLGSFQNGKIIKKIRDNIEDIYFSFFFSEVSVYGEDISIGFNGKFYVENNEYILKGILSGRIYLASGAIIVFSSDQYKFSSVQVSYMSLSSFTNNN